MIDRNFIERFEEFGPASRSLSLLLRPSIVADEGHTLVWGDWSAIEARVLPWLADTRGSRAVLDVFKGNDSDPNKPDIYVIEACNLSGEDPQDVWDRYRNKDKAAKDARGRGKVSVLSLGFGGSIGALQAMATNYGVHYDDATAQVVVGTWRASNRWARTLWDGLWEAALQAYESPDTVFPVGKVAYVYDKSYLGGTMFCGLPCSRLLTYPKMKWTKTEVEDPRTGKIKTRKSLTYMRGYGRAGLWYGKLAENITQATAGSLIRQKLVELAPLRCVVGHTHDEIVTQQPTATAQAFKSDLRDIMVANPSWMTGCPLAAEVTENWYYTKAVE